MGDVPSPLEARRFYRIRYNTLHAESSTLYPLYREGGDSRVTPPPLEARCFYRSRYETLHRERSTLNHSTEGEGTVESHPLPARKAFSSGTI